ncbi:SAF domain-containing protein, partial [Bradyrhizobium sp.]|uniref:SAF domain-containing protein n=1 Tax=Bradyrhizobium sp. TaxID=376 RepID=UPI0025B92680
FKRMVAAIRRIEQARGDGIKTPRNSEIKNIDIARKSIVAARALKAGEVLAPADLTCKRPGSGRPPIEYWSLIGTAVTRPYDEEDHL